MARMFFETSYPDISFISMWISFCSRRIKVSINSSYIPTPSSCYRFLVNPLKHHVWTMPMMLITTSISSVVEQIFLIYRFYTLFVIPCSLLFAIFMLVTQISRQKNHSLVGFTRHSSCMSHHMSYSLQRPKHDLNLLDNPVNNRRRFVLFSSFKIGIRNWYKHVNVSTIVITSCASA